MKNTAEQRERQGIVIYVGVYFFMKWVRKASLLKLCLCKELKGKGNEPCGYQEKHVLGSKKV